MRAVTYTYIHIRDISLQIRDISLSTDLAGARRGPATWALACDSGRRTHRHLWARLSSLPSGRIGTPRRDHMHRTSILRASLCSLSSSFSLCLSRPFFVPSVPSGIPYRPSDEPFPLFLSSKESCARNQGCIPG